MLPLATLALIMPCAYAVGFPNPHPRKLIVGGSEAPKGRYSYAVALMDSDGTQYCGGSLIGNDVVLTAAHCIALDGNFTVVIGRQNLTNNILGEDVTVTSKVPHPNYVMSLSEDYDIGLIFLSRPTTANVDLVLFNTDRSLPVVGSGVTYLGWGEIDSDPLTVNGSQILREVESTVISNEQCEASSGVVNGANPYWDSYQGLITENMLCTFANDKDSCQRDSGGPLVMRGNDDSGDVQVGVASWGIGCASNVFPGVTARISAVHNWIEDNVCRKSIEPGPAFNCDNATLVESNLSELTVAPGEESGSNTLLESKIPDLLISSHFNASFTEIEKISDQNNASGGDITTLPKIDASDPIPILAEIKKSNLTDTSEGEDSTTLPKIGMSDLTNISEGDAARPVDSHSRSAGNIVLGIVVFACAGGCLLFRMMESHRLWIFRGRRAEATLQTTDPNGSTHRIGDTWLESPEGRMATEGTGLRG